MNACMYDATYSHMNCSCPLEGSNQILMKGVSISLKLMKILEQMSLILRGQNAHLKRQKQQQQQQQTTLTHMCVWAYKNF